LLDYLLFGNAFLEQRHSLTSQLIKLLASPAKYTRRGVDDSIFWFVENFTLPHEVSPDIVFHLLEPDINQEIYGLPEYQRTLNSAWLNESATLFRRKYYQNGAHAGYIMYVTDQRRARPTSSRCARRCVTRKGSATFRTCFSTLPAENRTALKSCH
jgi:capsid portal protein